MSRGIRTPLQNRERTILPLQQHHSRQSRAGRGNAAEVKCGRQCVLSRFFANGAGNFRAEHLQTLVVTQLMTNDIRGSKCFVRLRAADNGLLGPIAILIV